METKSYIGKSRPCGDYDKVKLTIIDNNLICFNRNRKKKILRIDHYVDGGDKWVVIMDNYPLLSDLTLDQVYYTVAGIIRYTNEMK